MNKTGNKARGLVKWFLPFYLFTFSPLLSCSEQEEEEEEYANWQQRNDDYFASLKSKLTGSTDGYTWRALKSYTLDSEATSTGTDCIYVCVLESGEAEGSPIATDSVRVSYRGRLMPSRGYSEGYVFDQTYTGDFSWQTTGVASNATTASFVDGFSTALMYMHRGDRWRIYIPYQLGYNATEKTGIPSYSTLIFDLALVDWWHPGESRPDWQ